MSSAGRGGGPRIDASWCFTGFASAIGAHSGTFVDGDVTARKLRLYRGGALEIFYAPVDYVNRSAKVLIVGITPGRQQARIALNAAQEAMSKGLTGHDVVKHATHKAGFGGPMRANLIDMLDEIGLDDALGLDSCAELFADSAHLVSLTSAVLNPAFVDGENYRGTGPPISAHPVLREFAGPVLAATLAMAPRSLVIPLGKAATAAVEGHVERGSLPVERCLLGMPHPSPANGHRVPQFRQRKRILRAGVARWSKSAH
jgi:hypothetical protein